MMLDIGNAASGLFWHQAHTGSTNTGLADAFSSFWFFGSLIFFGIGYIMNRWYRAASAGNFTAQLVVILTITPNLLS